MITVLRTASKAKFRDYCIATFMGIIELTKGISIPNTNASIIALKGGMIENSRFRFVLNAEATYVNATRVNRKPIIIAGTIKNNDSVKIK